MNSVKTIGAWTGGYLDFSGPCTTGRAAGLPAARFEMIVRSDGWQWAWDGKAENPIPDLFPVTVWPEEQLRYNGHYPHGDEIIISYSVQGRAVLESPKLERIGENTVIHHRLTVHAGENPLELIVLDDQPEIKGKTATIGYSIAWLQAKHDGVKFRASENGKLVLHIPASSKTLHLNVALSHDESDSLKEQTPSHQVVNLLEHPGGRMVLY